VSLYRVAEAAKKGLTDQVARLASLAKNCDSVIETMRGLEVEVERIKKALKNMEHDPARCASRPLQQIAPHRLIPQRFIGARADHRFFPKTGTGRTMIVPIWSQFGPAWPGESGNVSGVAGSR
jgi:hypothetical protein